MAVFTASTIKQFARISEQKTITRENKQRTVTASRDVGVFLSHSHSDLESLEPGLLGSIKSLFADANIKVYIDSMDPEMPSVTSGITAIILRTNIELLDKFVVIATTNAVNSNWVPWELGFADKAKTLRNVAVLPIADKHGNWPNREYFSIYPRIEYELGAPYYNLTNYVTPPVPVVKTINEQTITLNEWLLRK